MPKTKRNIKPKGQKTSRPNAVTVATQHNRRDVLFIAIPVVVAVVTFVTYLPVLWNGFVGWDDDENILNNPYFRGLGWARLRWMFTTFHLGHYQPLSWLTFAIDYLWWGINPLGYHLTNLLLHVANAVLFYFLVSRVLTLADVDSRKSQIVWFASGVAALLFAIHPLRVESVAWITERRDVLSGLFFLGTLLFYLRGATSDDRGTRRLWLGVALVFYVLSLFSKAIGMTLPVVLLVLDVYPLRRLGWEKHSWFGRASREIWLEKLPFVILAVGAGVLALMAQSRSGAMKSLDAYGFFLRVFQTSYGLSFYLWKTLLPLDLSPLYQIPKFIDPTAPAFLISSSLVLGLTIILIKLRRRWPAGLAVWICYTAILAPVLGIAQSGEQFVADRYSYLSCLGWALLTGVGAAYLWRRLISRKVVYSNLAGFILLCLAVLSVLATMTWRQTKIWHDSETLWRHALQLDPSSSAVHNNLASALLENGKSKEAIDLYQKALQIDPEYAEAHFNLGMAYAGMDQLDVATAEFLTGLKFNPRNAKAHHYLGLLYARRGNLSSAIERFHESLKLSPSESSVRVDLGTALAMQGNIAEAVDEFRQAIAIHPDSASAHHKLGRVLAAQNRLAEATREFREALRINPDYAAAHLSLGEALAEQGLRDEAAQHHREAIRLHEMLRQQANPGT